MTTTSSTTTTSTETDENIRLTPQRAAILQALAAAGGTIEDKQGFATNALLEALEAIEGKDSQSMNSLKNTIKTLNDRKLIVREVQGRRVKSITLSPKGWKVIESRMPGSVRMERAVKVKNGGANVAPAMRLYDGGRIKVDFVHLAQVKKQEVIECLADMRAMNEALAIAIEADDMVMVRLLMHGYAAAVNRLADLGGNTE